MSFSFKPLQNEKRFLLCVFCLTALLITGCNRDSSSSEESNLNEIDSSQMAQDMAEESESPWDGRWELLINNQASDFRSLIAEIREFSGERRLRLLAKSPVKELDKWQLTGGMFTENTILMIINTGEIDLRFEGIMHDGIILGNLFPEGQMTPSPARMIKTSLLDLQEAEVQEKTEGTDDFGKVTYAEDKLTALKEFVKEHPNSPLVFPAYNMIFSEALDQKLSLEQMQAIAEEMKESALRWGVSIVPQVYLEILENTVEIKTYRPLAEESMKSLKEIVGEEPLVAMKNMIDEFQARLDLSSDDKKLQAKGEAAIQNIIKATPLYLKMLVTLAQYYERNDRIDEALTIYSRLAVLPGLADVLQGMNFPGQDQIDVVKKTRTLWKGEEDKFEQYLDDVYEKEAFFFTEKESPKMELRPGRRISLVEMFTGAVCPPCVAGDLALGGVEKMHPAPQFIAVRYHQHIPGPDPLTVLPGEARFNYYQGPGTPMMLINGRQVEAIGGQIFNAQQRYMQIYPQIKNLISQISLVKLELSASIEDGVVKIHAKAENIPELRKNAKLRLLIVEPSIKYVAANGIRHHEMVVRDMPGGPDGKLATNKTVELKIERSMTELHADIIKELKSLEKNRGATFDYLPSEMKQLRVIAFVQDDTTREILQSAISPVLTLKP